MDVLPSFLAQAIDVFLHLDKHLGVLIEQYGVWVYGILFAIIFIETGLVVMPFLPGDSLLFVVGAFCAAGGIDLPTIIGLLTVAAILGDALNYSIGRWVGPKVFGWQDSRWFNRKAFDRAHAFYETHGGKTIILARFVPLVRTFAPFVAGVAQMSYGRFAMFNVVGAIAWVVSLTVAGYLFGNIPWVRKNLEVIVIGIVVLSVLPVVFEWLKARRQSAKQPAAPARAAATQRQPAGVRAAGLDPAVGTAAARGATVQPGLRAPTVPGQGMRQGTARSGATGSAGRADQAPGQVVSLDQARARQSQSAPKADSKV